MSIQLAAEPETGRIVLHFVLPAADHPGAVPVVGSFNDWTPGVDLLIDHGDGTIGVKVPLDAGSVIHFRYLGSNDRWFDDPDAEQVTAEGGIFHVPDHLPTDAETAVSTEKRSAKTKTKTKTKIKAADSVSGSGEQPAGTEVTGASEAAGRPSTRPRK